MDNASSQLVDDCKYVENSVKEKLIDSHNQLKVDYSLLKKVKKPMSGSVTYAGLNMSTYCKYTTSLIEFSHDEIVDATKFALFKGWITFKDIQMCYKQVEAQYKADQAIEYEINQAKRKIEQEQRKLVCCAFEIVDSIYIGISVGEERTELAYCIVSCVENGDFKRDLIYLLAEEACKERMKKRQVEQKSKRLTENQLKEYKTDNLFNTYKDTNNTNTFRGKPIKWVDEVRYKTFERKNAFENDIEEYERYNGKNHFIEYDREQYKQDDFFQTYFKRYREVQKRVEFNNDTLTFLSNISTSQCEKLQYHILAQYFPLVDIDEQDIIDLRLFAFRYDSNYKRFYIRLNWENGLAKMITVGAGLQVRGKPTAEQMYCYQQYLKHDKATYTSVNMTWETWSIAIIKEVENKHKDDAIKAMYYQDEIYMTWTEKERKTVEHWIKNYKGGAIFPYNGEIERGESRTIVFKRDCKIVDNIRTKETRAQYNKENAAELAAARGKVRHNKAAINDYKQLVGNEWTTAELLIMLDNNNKKIKRLVDEKLIECIRRGYYRRKIS